MRDAHVSIEGQPLSLATIDRRMERRIADDFELTMTRALAKLDAANAKDVQALAALYERVRGYGHVSSRTSRWSSAANATSLRASASKRRPGDAVRAAIDTMKGTASLKGIPVVVAR